KQKTIIFFMSLEQKIMTELKTAMLAKDEAALRSLRAIKAAILLARTAEGASGELKEEEEIKLLQKLVKQRKDSFEIFEQQNRTDLAQKEQEEIAIIEKFLPRQLSAEELKQALTKIIADTGATSPADLGKVMGIASKQFAGKADGKTIATLVKELLTP
ncbi:MAG TPA: GatB/YqeY domain-containing protein, partial [Ignavibacteriaceae bacterium]